MNRYERIIEEIFVSHFQSGMRQVEFDRDELVRVAKRLKVKLPKNLGDIIYSFRYRASLPPRISEAAPVDEFWVIRPVGRARYRFELTRQANIVPNPLLEAIKLPDATPGLISQFALNDEQALLAKLRYNRLIDVFTGAACYSLQNHLRTTVPNLGQIETDEVYVGLDRAGVQYVFPVQAKGGRDQLSIVQIEQDFALCDAKFSTLVCRPIAAQFMDHEQIALFEFVKHDAVVAMRTEKHYRLVSPDEVTPEDLLAYRSATQS